MQVEDVRLNIFLNLSIEQLSEFCFADKLAKRICNSIEFWRLRYIKDGIDPPLATNLTATQHILYIKTKQYMKFMNDDNILIINLLHIPDPMPQFADQDKFSLPIHEILYNGGGLFFIKLDDESDNYKIAGMEVFTSSDIEFSDKTIVPANVIFDLIQYTIMFDYPIYKLTESSGHNFNINRNNQGKILIVR